MFLLFSSIGVVMWSQGSSAVVKSCHCNLFQIFLNFLVLFKWCSCSSPQVVWSCDLRVQMLCSSDVPLIYFNFSLIFKCCSSDVLAILLKWCDHVPVIIFNFFLIFKCCSSDVVMWSQGSSGLFKKCSSILLLFFCYLCAHVMLIKFAF